LDPFPEDDRPTDDCTDELYTEQLRRPDTVDSGLAQQLSATQDPRP